MTPQVIMVFIAWVRFFLLKITQLKLVLTRVGSLPRVFGLFTIVVAFTREMEHVRAQRELTTVHGA